MSDLAKRINDLSSERLELLFLQASKKRKDGGRSVIRPQPRESNTFPLSFAQRRLWFLDQLVPESAAYTIPQAVRLTGTLDMVALRRSLDDIGWRHEALRTIFAVVDGQPMQVILPALALPLPVVDLASLPQPQQEIAVQGWLDAVSRASFDLAHGPLIRTMLLRLGATEHLLLLSMHHIISDSWSLGVFVQDLAPLYGVYAADGRGEATSPLPPLPIQYADYAVWQRAWLQGPVLEAQIAYWRAQLGGSLPVLALPTDRPRPPVQTFRGAAQSFGLPPPLTRALNALSQGQGVTLFMTLLAVFETLLTRYTGQEDLLVGTPIANRTRVETERLIGFFANTLVLRTNLAGNPPFLELLRRVREICLGAYAHQDLPFEQLVEELQPTRDLSRNPLFQVMFVLQNTPMGGLELPGLTLCPVQTASGTAKFDWWLSITEGATELFGVLEYNTDLFDATTIARMLRHLRSLLEAIVAQPDQPIAALPLLTIAEQQHVLLEWNDTRRGVRGQGSGVRSEHPASDLLTSDSWLLTPGSSLLTSAFEAQVARTPDTVAVVFDGTTNDQRLTTNDIQDKETRRQGDKQIQGHRTDNGSDFIVHRLSSQAQHLTYRELNECSNQLARRLRALSVGPDQLVGICMERSLELVVGLLGILKAGGAYVPLDPSYPAERIAFMLEDAQVAVLLSAGGEAGGWGLEAGSQSPVSSLQSLVSRTVVDLRRDWPQIARQPPEPTDSGVSADHLAYVIYTSGSTGTPKGVMVAHRAIVNRLRWMQDAFRLAPDDAVLQKTPFSFDVSVWEFFWPLLAGARLVLARPDGHRDLPYLVRLIEEQAITTLHFVPSVLQLFLEEPDLERCYHLRRVICSGEALPFELQERFFSWLDAPLHNLYGPTEAAVDVTNWPCAGAEHGRRVPIGRPIANTQIYLLDRRLNPLPIGVPGELHIGGVQVARGYHRRPDLTAERFIPDPTTDDRTTAGGRWSVVGGRLYKTGDLARYLPDGTIEFLGRIDHQVKLHGIRVELGEIESTLRRHSTVRDAIVAVRSDAPGDQQLVAYILPRDEPYDGGAQSAAAALPAERVTEWQHVFDETYTQAAPLEDPAFNIAGWRSSYTSEPLAAEEMREWVDQTVARIRALQPRRVLEIGCGTGLLLWRLAPGCDHYYGTDISPVALRALDQQLRAAALPQVELAHRAADDFAGLAEAAFDTVILNSVVQYFPGIDYLVRVLAGAARALAPGGRIFIGDVRSLPLLETFHSAVELYQAPDSLPTTQLQQRVRKRVLQENELVIDPAFFFALQAQLPAIGHVAVQLKRGQHHNELTRYRYDVILHKTPVMQPVAEVTWLDWQREGLSLQALRRQLQRDAPDMLGVARVPNARLLADAPMMALLAAPDRPETVGALRAALQAYPRDGVDPEALWALGDELPYTVTISWSGSGADGRYDALFQRRTRAGAALIEASPAGLLPHDPSQPLRSYANNPLQDQLAQRLVPALQSYVKEQLPGYMLPSAFVLLDALPLTPNGKLDRDALPAPLRAVPDMETDFVAPRTPVERTLAGIWTQILGLERIGVDNNFFALGGDSLDSVRVIARANQSGLQLTPRDLFLHQTIAELAAVVEAGGRGAGDQRPAATAAPRAPLASLDQSELARLIDPSWEIEDIYPLAPHQEHMLSRYLGAPVPGLYVWQRFSYIPIPLDIDMTLLEQVLQRLVARHPLLRSAFLWQGLSQPLQLVHRSGKIPLEQQDWRGLSPAEQEARLLAYTEADRSRNFPLDEPVAMRMLIARLTDTLCLMSFSCHYLRLDGWSSGLLSDEFFALYQALSHGETLELEPLPPYRDYIAWLQQQDLSEAETFWRQRLAGLALPTPLVDRAPGNAPDQTDGFAREHLYLPASTTAELQSLAQQQHLTLNTLIQGAWALLLSRYSGMDEIVYGVIVAGRPATLPGTELMAGAFVNVLPLRVRIQPEAALLPWLHELHAEQVEISQYEYTPLEKLREWIDMPQTSALFESLLVFQNLWHSNAKTAHQFFAQMEYPLRIDIFPESELGLVMSYYRRCFDSATIRRMLQHLQAALSAMAANPQQPLGAIIRRLDLAEGDRPV